ncbi:hypothetical protein C4569_01135 [Candidatus Parcubacteria bacterium]|nr:MAG: hypothetical protein C4569_01135 [Candidatus Parcubacteria bacterium]
MALDLNQQIEKQISDAKHVLISFRKDFTADGISSALALYLFLKKKNKLTEVVCQDFSLPKNLKFLPENGVIKNKLTNLQKFIVSLDITKTPLDEFSYNLEKEKLNIYITPKRGIFNKDDLATSTSDYKYDLIFVLDSPDFESLGAVYDDNTEFFYNTTVVNIDNNPQNEHFGQINLTNLNAVSVSEIVFDFLNAVGQELIDSDIATCLLAGIISKTRSFKTPNVTPKVLKTASDLINMEADREKIVKSLYRTRSIATLKLWGRVLARLKTEPELKIAWSILNSYDFLEAQATEEDLPEVIDELISTMPGIDLVVLLYQLEAEKVCGIVQTLKDTNVLYLTKQLRPRGSKNQSKFCLEKKTLPDAEKEVIDVIRQNLKQA